VRSFNTYVRHLAHFASVQSRCLTLLVSIALAGSVHADNFKRYRKALGFKAVESKTGGGDRLMILYDSDRLALVDYRELFRHGKDVLNNGNYRSPLVCRFLDQPTGREFLFVTVHLARGKPEIRQEQARGLRNWARDQAMPIIAAGDFNFDANFKRKTINQAFVEFRKDRIWRWVTPRPFVDTNWADRNGDGVDDYPDSMLDFFFVAGSAKEWAAECTVIVDPGDFPDGEKTSDHRPVTAAFGVE